MTLQKRNKYDAHIWAFLPQMVVKSHRTRTELFTFVNNLHFKQLKMIKLGVVVSLLAETYPTNHALASRADEELYFRVEVNFI